MAGHTQERDRIENETSEFCQRPLRRLITRLAATNPNGRNCMNLQQARANQKPQGWVASCKWLPTHRYQPVPRFRQISIQRGAGCRSFSASHQHGDFRDHCHSPRRNRGESESPLRYGMSPISLHLSFRSVVGHPPPYPLPGPHSFADLKPYQRARHGRYPGHAGRSRYDGVVCRPASPAATTTCLTTAGSLAAIRCSCI